MSVMQCKNPNCNIEFEAGNNRRNTKYCDRCRKEMRNAYMQKYRSEHRQENIEYQKVLRRKAVH